MNFYSNQILVLKLLNGNRRSFVFLCNVNICFRYKTHGDRTHSLSGGLTNGKKKKIKKPLNAMGTKSNCSLTTRFNTKTEEDQNETSGDEEDDDDDESEPMDFERAFGSSSDLPKLEHMDIHQNNGNFDDLNIREGEFYFDLTSKVDLNNYQQPVLISSTINLNPLAAVSHLQTTFDIL